MHLLYCGTSFDTRSIILAHESVLIKTSMVCTDELITEVILKDTVCYFFDKGFIVVLIPLEANASFGSRFLFKKGFVWRKASMRLQKLSSV